MLSKTWDTNNCNTHIDHISRNKDNQTIKFGRLLEYSMRNIFLEKLYTKYEGETIPRPFSKNSKMSISFNQ